MKTYLLFSLFPVINFALGQIDQFKKIEVKGVYIHDSSKTKFLSRIGEFNRIQITSFDDTQANIGVGYFCLTSHGVANVDIYIYPAGKAFEDRLYHEYTTSLQAIATIDKKGLNTVKHHLIFIRNNHKVIGLTAYSYDSINSKHTMLTIFECGKWFLKYRLTSNYLDELNLDSVQNIFLNVVSPIDITKRFPFKKEFAITVVPTAMRDTVLLHAVLADAFNKKEWMYTHIDSLESMSGVPSLYLEPKTQSLLEFVNDGRSTRLNSVLSTNQYYKNLKLIIDKGYIDEFVMAQYSMTLIPSSGTMLDMDEYIKWAKIYIPGFKLNYNYYLISYPDQ